MLVFDSFECFIYNLFFKKRGGIENLTHIPEQAIDGLYIRELTSVTTANISEALIEAFIADSYLYLIMSENEGQKKRMLDTFDEKIEALLASLMDKGYASWILTYIDEGFKKQLASRRDLYEGKSLERAHIQLTYQRERSGGVLLLDDSIEEKPYPRDLSKCLIF